jgi:hypothetical protein
VLCAVTIPPADLRSLSLYYYTVCGRMCISSVRVWCSCLLVYERKSVGGIVTAQSTAEDPLKMVVKKDRNV